jgi:hypothetical protein
MHHNNAKCHIKIRKKKMLRGIQNWQSVFRDPIIPNVDHLLVQTESGGEQRTTARHVPNQRGINTNTNNKAQIGICTS